jgi:prephenate dehydrogenase
MKKQIALLGLGRFGGLMASILSPFSELVAYDAVPDLERARRLGVPMVPLEEAAAKPILILAVPISNMRELLESIAPFVRRDALVCDTCSVKIKPIALMRAILPEHAQILGTHPCFGPDSVRPGLTGNRIVLCPVRLNNLDCVRGFLESLGLTVIVSDPEEHDRAMSVTQGISHFLGKAVLKMGLKQERISTDAFSRLFDILQYVENDTEQLFRDIQTWNPFCREVRVKLMDTLRAIHESLNEGADSGRRP